MSVPSLEEDLFKMAGLEKDTFLGRWDFLLSPFRASAAESQASAQSVDKDEESRMRIIDSIDLDNLDNLDTEVVTSPTTAAIIPSEEKEAVSTTKKKKSKKKKTAAKSAEKCVKWGTVEQICFSRSIGYDVIPNKGVYPIGLGVEKERVHSTVDQLYIAQQQSLLQRAVAMGVQFKSVEPEVPPPPAPVQSPSPQVTVSKGRKNHRTRSSSVSSVGSVEAEASAPAAVSVTTGLNVLQTLETRQYDYKTTTNPLFAPLGEDERIALLTSATVDIVHDPNFSSNPLTEINNEIKTLKANRDSGGCNCKHMKADKMSVAKLKSELVANKHLICYEATPAEIEKLPKAELMKKVKETLKQCVLCVENDCQCVQLGIQCSAQLCGCLRGGHHPGQAQSCANALGVDVYDLARVKQYRKTVLDRLRGIEPSAADMAN
jgi:hypothetical protein